MNTVDLHMHSTESDGTRTPEALMEHAHACGVKTLALTDHDTVSGLERAEKSADPLGIEFIPGVEISAQFKPGTMHILGYFFNPKHSGLLDTLRDLQNARSERNPEIIRKLQAAGIDIRHDEVIAASGGGQVGRPHFAAVLLKKGVVRSLEEAFDKYLKKGAAAYVDKRRLSPRDCIRALREAGGVSVLAHPKQLKMEGYDRVEELIAELKEYGLGGVEVYHSGHNRTEAKHYKQIAERLELVATGGSDYHGDHKHRVELGVLAGGKELPYETVDELREKAGRG